MPFVIPSVNLHTPEFNMMPQFGHFRSAFSSLGLLLAAGSAFCADYYIDSKKGDNANNGADEIHAWRDFTHLNGRTLVPGDRVLLASGSLWDQELLLRGSGTPDQPIILTSYGSGAKPHIARQMALTDRTVTLIDASHWRISNLELSHANMGLEIDYSGFGSRDVEIDRLYIHDIDLNIDGVPSGPGSVFYSTGILVSYRPEIPNPSQFVLSGLTGMLSAETPKIKTPGPDEFTLSGLTISRCEIARTTAPIVVGTSFVVGNYSPRSFRDVLIKDNSIHDARGPINTAFITHGLWLNNIVTRVATSPLIQGTTGIFVSNTKGLRFVNNWISHIADTASHDQSAIDFEAFDDRPDLHGNVIADTAGVAVELLFIDDGIFQEGEANHNTNVTLNGNLFLRNTHSRGTNDLGRVILGAFGGRIKDPYNQTGTVSHNLVAEQKDGFKFAGKPGAWDQFQFKNNLDVGNNYVSNAAIDYPGCNERSEWSHQVRLSGAWRNLAYDAADQVWGSADGHVGRFNLLPPPAPGGRIARVWTAPTSGAISIRGRVLKNLISAQGGVRVAVTLNDRVIWPVSGEAQLLASNDRVGVDTHLDGIPVAAGDILRFEVGDSTSGDASHDLTSWIPTIAYTAGSLAPARPLD